MNKKGFSPNFGLRCGFLAMRIQNASRFVLGMVSILLGSALTFSQVAGTPGVKKARILVGPNILVSRDGEFPHVELMAAAHPNKSGSLLGAAITFSRPDGSAACKAYASKDGGYTWFDSSFPEQIQFGGGDPQVAFGLGGTAYFCGLAMIKDDQDRTRAGLHFYRSEDGGFSWGKMTDLGYSYDHEQIVVDHTFGKYAGRIYIGTLWGYPEYQLGVFRSDDDGRTFVGPVKCASGRGEIGVNVCNMLLFSDGGLFVPYGDFPFKPEEAKVSDRGNFWSVTSADGGVAFSQPRKIGYQLHPKWDDMIKARKAGGFLGQGFPMFAVDNKSEAFKDRLYVVWDDIRFGKHRILIISSWDRGETWSEPRILSTEGPAWSSQYQPMIFVNKEGTVGIMWYDTRASKLDDRSDLYFTASIDGGENFLAPVKVTSAPSFPAGDNNLVPGSLYVEAGEKSVKVSGTSAYARWGNGGDYMGLTADVNGVFHPFWADSRGRGYQVRTCPIVVKVEETKPEKDAEGIRTESPALPRKEKAHIQDKIELVYDPVGYDVKTGIATIPVRIKNKSKEAVSGPFTVRVKTFVNEEMKKYQGDGWDNIPEVVNAANGLPGAGAVFDYSRALGDFETLEPGATTETVEWKLRFPNPKLTDLFVEVEVEGYVFRK